MTPLALAVLAALLLWPAPIALAGARWTRREPRAALVLWQALGLSAGLALIGAAISVALAPIGGSLFGAMFSLVTGRKSLPGTHVVLLVLALGLGGWFLGVLAYRLTTTILARRRHRELVDLVGTPWPEQVGGRVLDHPAAVAYCLPGSDSRVVLSSGVFDLLDAEEVTAVLAHERAHLAERHDLVVLPFVAWTSALPGLPGVRRSRAAVATLIEMLADDRACRVCDRAALATALARVGSAGAPAGGLAVAGGATVERVRRLLDPPAPSLSVRVLGYAAAALLLAVPTLALLATSM